MQINTIDPINPIKLIEAIKKIGPKRYGIAEEEYQLIKEYIEIEAITKDTSDSIKLIAPKAYETSCVFHDLVYNRPDLIEIKDKIKEDLKTKNL